MSTKIDIGAIINQGIQTGFAWLNKTIGVGASPLNQTTTAGQVKVGNVGGLLGINLSWGAIAIIGVGLIGVVFLIKKVG